MLKIFSMFKSKQVNKEFCFVGNRPMSRTLEEMQLVNKKEADLAFLQYKKEIIDTLLFDNGFLKYKTRAYVRINRIGLLEYIDLQKERYGSKTFCVNFSVIPLYCDCKCINSSIDYRLGMYISGKDVWWDYGSEVIAKGSMKNVSIAIEAFVLPWFEKVSTVEGYKAELLKICSAERAEKWIDAMENIGNEELIQQSIEKLELPSKIQRYT